MQVRIMENNVKVIEINKMYRISRMLTMWCVSDLIFTWTFDKCCRCMCVCKGRGLMEISVKSVMVGS